MWKCTRFSFAYTRIHTHTHTLTATHNWIGDRCLSRLRIHTIVTGGAYCLCAVFWTGFLRISSLLHAVCHVAAVSISTTDSRILPRCMRIYNALARCPTHNMYLSHMPSLYRSRCIVHMYALVWVWLFYLIGLFTQAPYTLKLRVHHKASSIRTTAQCVCSVFAVRANQSKFLCHILCVYHRALEKSTKIFHTLFCSSHNHPSYCCCYIL